MQLLEKLEPQQTLIRPVDRLALILSGQSDFSHSELSPEQKALLALLGERGFSVIDMGFPFHQQHAHRGCQRASIVKASLRNGQQYICSLFIERYKRLIARHLQPILDQNEKVVIVCQSLGLHMFNVARPFLDIKNGARITLIALGPVMWGKMNDPRCKVIVVKGRRDWLSVVFDRQPVDVWVSCRHMDYCQNKQVQDVVIREACG